MKHKAIIGIIFSFGFSCFAMQDQDPELSKEEQATIFFAWFAARQDEIPSAPIGFEFPSRTIQNKDVSRSAKDEYP